MDCSPSEVGRADDQRQAFGLVPSIDFRRERALHKAFVFEYSPTHLKRELRVEPVMRWSEAEVRTVARPEVATQRVDAKDSRVAVDVARDSEKIAIRVDEDRVVPVLAKSTVLSVLVVEIPGVMQSDEVHHLTEVPARRMDEQVIVIPHQAVRVDLSSAALRRHFKKLKEYDPIICVEEDQASARTAIDDVIPRAWVLNSEWSGHSHFHSDIAVRGK